MTDSAEPTFLEVCAAVVQRRQRFLLARRPAGSHLAGKWEFPGGKIHAGETREQCIVRELEEELGVTVTTPALLTTVEHHYPEKSIRLHFLRCRWPAGAEGTGHDNQEFGWFARCELTALDLAPADRRFVEEWLLVPSASRDVASVPLEGERTASRRLKPVHQPVAPRERVGVRASARLVSPPLLEGERTASRGNRGASKVAGPSRSGQLKGRERDAPATLKAADSNAARPRTFFLRTYGCQMNERDSEALACLLEANGLLQVEDEAAADVLLYNTCSVREQAERKAIGKLGLLVRLKRQRPEIIVGAIGCMAQRLGAELLEQIPHLDFVAGTEQIHRLPELIAEAAASRRRQVCTEQGAGEGIEVLGRHRPGQVSAYVAVMRGCNQMCTYCVVPAVRGRETSRPIPDIVEEIRGLARQGTKEFFLLVQNITAYGIAEARRDGRYTPELSPFAELLRAIGTVPEARRIRFTSPHPRFMNRAFVDAVRDLPQLCDSFHVPVQSGADRVLAAMHRGYTAAEYLDRIRALRTVRPECTFSTDVIVGYPGETDAEFAATRELMHEVGFDMAYIFKYSPRPSTAAAKLVDDVPQAVKEARLKLLLDDMEARVAVLNRRYSGRDLEVLVEGPSLRNPQTWTGRTSGNKVVIFAPASEIHIGDFVTVRITRVTAHSLFGDVSPK